MRSPGSGKNPLPWQYSVNTPSMLGITISYEAGVQHLGGSSLSSRKATRVSHRDNSRRDNNKSIHNNKSINNKCFEWDMQQNQKQLPNRTINVIITIYIEMTFTTTKNRHPAHKQKWHLTTQKELLRHRDTLFTKLALKDTQVQHKTFQHTHVV